MDGIHDLGGRHGFGEVVVEADEPAFHERWEAQVFAINLMTVSMEGVSNIDRWRHAIERMDPVSYLTDTYYGRWLAAIETVLVEGRVLDQADITKRAISLGASPDARVAARPRTVPDPFLAPTDRGYYRAIERTVKFSAGDRIETVVTDFSGHTRLPSYARGTPGVIADYRGSWVFPDANAHGGGEQPQHLYSVAFNASDLYGSGADDKVKVHLDLFEPYLAKQKGGSPA